MQRKIIHNNLVDMTDLHLLCRVSNDACECHTEPDGMDCPSCDAERVLLHNLCSQCPMDVFACQDMPHLGCIDN